MGLDITRTLGMAGAAAALTSCDFKTAESASFHRVDNDHYVIPGDCCDDGVRFSSNLSKWRDNVSGDFTLVPLNANFPVVGMAAFRTTTTNLDGDTNTIRFSKLEGAGAK